MATNPLNAIIDEIRIDLNQFVDDDRLSKLDDYLYDKVHAARASLIREEYNQKGKLSDQYYQINDDITVTCEQTEVTIGSFTITSNKKIFTAQLPDLVENIGWKDISYLGKDAFEQQFSRVSLKGFLSSQHGRYMSKKTLYMVYGSKAFFKNMPHKTQKIIGALIYKNPTDHPLFTEESEYFSPSRKKIVLLVKKDLLATWNIPFDEINDARGAVIVPKQQKQKVS